jgi:hypothetical protein
MSIEDYLRTVEDGRRADVARLCALIAEAAPGLEVDVSPSGVGFGHFHYRYASGREGDSHLISVVNRKQHVSLYVNCVHDGAYLAERHADRLPKADVGRSCVRFKRLDDLDLDALRQLAGEAAATGPAGAA